MSSSDTPPPAAAAAASAAPSQDNDETLARKWAAMEQLTQVYGFGHEAASQAIDILGPDVSACCAFILDSGLGQDQGGPVVPRDDCPHLDQHFVLSLSQLLLMLGDSFDPSNTVCSHFQDAAGTGGGQTSGTPALGSAKVDVDNDTGNCPSKENWLCLECGVLRCSRYVNGHGLQHWETTRANASTEETPKVGHCIALSLSDLSVWCYQCGSYLKHPSLDPLLQKLEELKFQGEQEGDLKPAAAATTNSE